MGEGGALAGAVVRPGPGTGPPRPASWRSGLGCGLAVLSVVGLLLVGQLAGTLGRRPDRDALLAQTPGMVARRLNGLPPPAQDVPATPAGVAGLLAAVGLPSGTARQAEFQPGDTVVAIGVTGACVFVDVHARRLTAWPVPGLAPCTAALAYSTVLGRRGTPNPTS